MRRLVPSGVWEIFVPDLTDGDCYKFEVRTTAGHLLHKADPYARRFEVPPNTASVIWTDSKYEWRDQDWLIDRASHDAWRERPMSVYEVHPGSWRRVPEEGNRFQTYRELAASLVPYVREMGFTHIELMPIMEHPFAGSWGYQVIGFFAPTSRFGTPDDFRFFVDECHRHGIGVILDWVPGHFPEGSPRPRGIRRHRALRARGSAEGRAPGLGHADLQLRPQRGPQLPVQQRAVLARGISHRRPSRRRGRVDALSRLLADAGEWIPNQYGGRENLEAVAFLQQLNTLTHGRVPGTMTIAEESTAWPAVSRPVYVGGLGFSYKWNMGWMHDMLQYIHEDPVHRRWHHGQITFSMLYAFTENFILPFSHDEVVHGKGSMLSKMPGDVWQKHATLRALYGYMYGHPGKKLMFMGAEFGQWREWNYDASLDWHLLGEEMHEALRRWVQDLNHTYQREPSLHEIDFEGVGIPLDRLPGQREQRDLDDPPRPRPAGLHRHGRELHAGAAAGLSRRRA